MIDNFMNGFLNRVYDLQDYTQLEINSKLIQKIEEVIDECNNAFEFVDWLKEQGVPDEVQTIIDTMLEDGTLEKLINLEKLNQLNNNIETINSQLDTKANKSDIETINSQLDTIVIKKEENIYVDLNGNDENDGLTISKPFKTIQKAFNYIKDDVKSSLVKKYIVNIGSGVFNEINILFDTPTVERVIIKGADVGEHPNTPITIINGSLGTNYEHGIRISGVGVKALVKDIKFINFKGGNSRIGLCGEGESDIITDNIHADGCDWCGIYAFNTVRAKIQGGILTNCRSGFIANSTQCSIGYTKGKATIISNCIESGIYWSRGSQGHIDYVDISECGIGIDISENSRVDTVKNTIRNNTIGIKTRNGGVYGEGGEPNIFENNTTDVFYQAFSGDTNELTRSTSTILVGYERLLKTASGQGTFELSKPYTIKARRLQGVGKYLKIDIYGIGNMSAGSSVIVTIGGMTIDLPIPSVLSSSVIKATIELFEVGGGYRAFGYIQGNLSTTRYATATSEFNSDIDNEIIISTKLAGSSDNFNMYRANVFING